MSKEPTILAHTHIPIGDLVITGEPDVTFISVKLAKSMSKKEAKQLCAQIIAAPDLLEACKEAAQIYATLVELCPAITYKHITTKLEAAIAKAEVKL